jgi:hypothetical protein
VLVAVVRLNEKERDAILGRYFLGLTDAEAATALMDEFERELGPAERTPAASRRSD